jgi:hypothetical protein
VQINVGRAKEGNRERSTTRAGEVCRSDTGDSSITDFNVDECKTVYTCQQCVRIYSFHAAQGHMGIFENIGCTIRKSNSSLHLFNLPS